MRRLLTILICIASFFVGRAAAACQYASCQSDGAVQLPSGADLSLPFKEGENVKILSGYGPTGGSSLHCRASDSQCANDWYALDLNLPDYPNSGKGQPVLAAAAGTVIDAAWGSQGWANYGQRVYIEHDFGDGHKYVTMYAHLDTMVVTKGQKVAKGDKIGTLGQSCQGALSCSSFSTPHVHFAVHQDPGFGGTGSGGSYGGHAVIPEPIDGHTGIQQGQTLVSKNGGTVTPPPPPTCATVSATADTIIEEECGDVTGGPLDDIGGHGGHAYRTVQDNVDPDYIQGIFWQLDFAQAGKYRLWAYIPALGSPSSGANYKIQHAGTAEKVLIDQSQVSDDWVELGSFDFAAGADQWVRLGDNYVNASDNGKQIGIDALRLTPDTGTSTPDAGVGGSGWGGAAGGISAAGSAGTGSGSGGSSSGAAPGDDSGGCGCRAAGTPAQRGYGALALLALALLLARRKKGRATDER